jgi:RND family efflux transporter MFP subunit
LSRTCGGARFTDWSGMKAYLLLTLLATLGACRPAAEPPAPEVRPVRTITIEKRVGGEMASLTGTVQSQTDVNLSFRVDGRMVTRSVNVGDTVRAGQLIATLNPENEQNGVTSARATLSAAQGQLTEARNNLERNKRLLAENFISQAAFDQIVQVERTARAQVDSAQAQLNIAQNRLGYTRLTADVGGVVTAVGAEPGEVVQGGRMILQLATEGGRDAVFDVPAQVKDSVPPNSDITVTLSMNPKVSAIGRVREVSPRADPVTGTFRVRVGLVKPPATMRLGSTVTGRVKLESASGVSIPSAALVRSDRQTAVWVVDPKDMTVSARTITVGESTAGSVAVAAGLNPGDIVVTAGVQALRPGQKVRLPESKQ